VLIYNIGLSDEYLTTGDLHRRVSNLSTRVIVWDAVMRAYSDASGLVKLIGWPFGQSPTLIVQSTSWGVVQWFVSVHSMYFGVLVSYGALGLAIYILLIITGVLNTIVQIISSKKIDGSALLSLMLFIVLAIYSYSYEFRDEQALYLALALSGCQAISWSQRNKKGVYRPG
jgi:O-antigen ligase